MTGARIRRLKNPLALLDPVERRAYDLDVRRIWPRIVMSVYIVAALYIAYWFTRLVDPTGPQAAFVSTTWGIFPLMLNFYSQNGPDWSRRINDRVDQCRPDDKGGPCG